MYVQKEKYVWLLIWDIQTKIGLLICEVWYIFKQVLERVSFLGMEVVYADDRHGDYFYQI